MVSSLAVVGTAAATIFDIVNGSFALSGDVFVSEAIVVVEVLNPIGDASHLLCPSTARPVGSSPGLSVHRRSCQTDG